jgi:hypothetical protein
LRSGKVCDAPKGSAGDEAGGLAMRTAIVIVLGVAILLLLIWRDCLRDDDAIDEGGVRGQPSATFSAALPAADIGS